MEITPKINKRPKMAYELNFSNAAASYTRKALAVPNPQEKGLRQLSRNQFASYFWESFRFFSLDKLSNQTVHYSMARPSQARFRWLC